MNYEYIGIDYEEKTAVVMTATMSFGNAATSKEDLTNFTSTKPSKIPFSNGKLNIYYLILTPGALIWFAVGVPHAFYEREKTFEGLARFCQ